MYKLQRDEEYLEEEGCSAAKDNQLETTVHTYSNDE